MTEPEKFWGASLARMVLFVALTLALFSVGFFVPVLGFGGFLAVPLPLAILGMRDGGRWQAAGVALSGGGLALLLDPLSALYYLIAQAPLSCALSFVSRGRRKGAEALSLCSGISVASKLLLLGVFLALTGHNPLIPDPDQIRLLLTRLYSELSLDGERAWALREAVDGMAALFPYMLPSLVLVSSLFEVFVNYGLGALCQRGRAQSLPPLPPFSDWRFSGTLLPAMFLAFLMGFFASDWTPGAMFAMNLKIVLNVFFFVQGLSLLWWWFARRRVGVFWRCLALAFFVLPVCWFWFVLLGVGDMIFDLRRRGGGAKG